MADFPFLLGLAAKAQPTRGTAVAMETIGNGAAIDNTTDGAVLGDPDSGEGGTGISVTLAKDFTEKAPLTGSFTRNFSNRIGTRVDSLQITIPLKGEGTTLGAPPTDADAELDPGIDALLESAGLIGGAWSTGVGQEYVPGATLLSTVALYSGGGGGLPGYRVIVRDVEAKSATFSFKPGEVGKLQFDMSGEFDELTAPATWDATPFDYGNQFDVAAPIVQNVGFSWLAREFGFSELSVVIDNQQETVEASNKDRGKSSRQSDRQIRISGKIDATDADIDFEMTQLQIEAIGSAQQLVFTVGTAMANGQPVEAYRIDVPDPELISVKGPIKTGGSQYYELEWIARGATDASEFSFVLL